jgi:N-acetylglucosaminyl-diphospho-decaprenol L-rhamnosyltransferase
MDTTAIIVNYNTKEFLLECVDSLKHYGNIPESRIIVVDNASIDDSLEALLGRFPKCEIIANTHNRGFGAANNQALHLVDTEYVLLINPDAALLPGALGAMENYLLITPNTAMVGPKTYYPDFSHQHTTFDFPTVWTELLKALPLRGLFLKIFPDSSKFNKGSTPNHTCNVGWLSGSCLLIRDSVMTSLEGFDERFFLYSEEVDLQYRVHQAGHDIVFLPQAEVIHHLGSSMSHVPEKSYVQLFRSKLQFAAKHYSTWKVYTLYAIWLSYNSVRLAVYFFPAITLGSSSAQRKLSKNLAATRYLLGWSRQKKT